jgi:hypothetical protein
MSALIPVVGNGLPPSRRALVDLDKRVRAAERRLATLRSGKAAPASELGRAAEAKSELNDLVAADAVRLVDRLRSGGQFLLSSFGNSRAKELSASLSSSRLQAAVGEKALASVSEEIADLERSIADMMRARAEATRAVLIESAGGFRTEFLTAIENLRDAMTTLEALDRVTTIKDGHYRPTDRVVVEVPAFGSLPEQAIVSPEACIERAEGISRDYSIELESNPLADIENLHFPPVNGNEDEGRILYDQMTRTERNAVDKLRS